MILGVGISVVLWVSFIVVLIVFVFVIIVFFFFVVDVNFILWRRKVVDEIYENVLKNKEKVLKDMFLNIK